MKRNITILLTILFIGFVGIGINDIRNNHVELELKHIELQDKALELKQITIEKEKLNQEFDKAIQEKDINEQRVRELEQEKLRLEEKTRQLERDLQAKRAEEQRIASVGITQKASATSYAGTKLDWLKASGIPEAEWWAVDYIVSRESSWNPNAVNKSSGACGLVQSLPCSKLGPNWNDPVVALKWQYQYVLNRYGGYSQAVAFWKVNHWY